MSNRCYSVGDLIRDTTDKISLGVLPQANQDSLIKAMAHLPARLTETVIFETRLGRNDAAVDVSMGIPRRAWPAFNERKNWANIPAHPLWDNIEQFMRQWGNPQSALYSAINQLWLEFDMPQARPLPLLFVDPKREIPYSFVRDNVFPLLLGQPLADETTRLQERCIQALPEGGRVYSFGMVLTRPQKLYRLNIDGLGCSRIIPYLQAIGWAGDIRPLSAMIDRLEPLTRWVLLDIDFDDAHLRPNLGLEINFLTRTQQATAVEYLVELGLCLPEKAKALADFHPSFGLNVLKPFTEAHKLLRGSTYQPSLTVSVSHIKLAYRDGQFVEAKAYLRIQQRWGTPKEDAEWQQWLLGEA